MGTSTRHRAFHDQTPLRLLWLAGRNALSFVSTLPYLLHHHSTRLYLWLQFVSPIKHLSHFQYIRKWLLYFMAHRLYA